VIHNDSRGGGGREKRFGLNYIFTIHKSEQCTGNLHASRKKEKDKKTKRRKMAMIDGYLVTRGTSL
jgi:hypothetical protein